MRAEQVYMIMGQNWPGSAFDPPGETRSLAD